MWPTPALHRGGPQGRLATGALDEALILAVGAFRRALVGLVVLIMAPPSAALSSLIAWSLHTMRVFKNYSQCTLSLEPSKHINKPIG